MNTFQLRTLNQIISKTVKISHIVEARNHYRVFAETKSAYVTYDINEDVLKIHNSVVKHDLAPLYEVKYLTSQGFKTYTLTADDYESAKAKAEKQSGRKIVSSVTLVADTKATLTDQQTGGNIFA